MRQSEIEWFRPLWLRLLVTGLVAAWFAFELLFAQDQLWMAITGAALAYAVWNLFIKYDEKAAAAARDKGGDGGDDKPQA